MKLHIPSVGRLLLAILTLSSSPVAATPLALRSGSSSSAACGDITVVFARGTTEPGDVGVIAGPPFFDEIEDRLGGGKKLVVQGVDYPANVQGFLAGGDAQGSKTM